jgi:hypothetical protein
MFPRCARVRTGELCRLCCEQSAQNPFSGSPIPKLWYAAARASFLEDVFERTCSAGQASHADWAVVTRLAPRWLVAVLGDINALKPWLWLEALGGLDQ